MKNVVSRHDDPMGMAEFHALRYFLDEIEECRRNVTAPMLRNLELIDEIYAWFLSIKSSQCEVVRNGIFVMVVARLYSPQVFLGRNMVKGLRDKIGLVLGRYKKPQNISSLLSQAIHYYHNNRGIRRETNAVFCEITERVYRTYCIQKAPA